jgi:hypothetical protein
VSGSDFTFNVAKGKVAYYTGLPAANDALIAILLKSSGLETDSTLKDYDDLASLLAGTSDEATDASYSRKTLTSVTVTVDDTNERVDLDCADITWTALAGAAIAKLVIVYDPDTTTGTDSTVIPIGAFSFDITPDGSDVTAQVSNFVRVT